MQKSFTTDRLELALVTPAEAQFIFQLVNMPAWIAYIGDRNVRNLTDAGTYISKIMDNPAISYYIVKLKDTGLSIGTVSFIKRDYLGHFDIGFAFLEAYGRKGYAYEAASAVLQAALKNPSHHTVLATVDPRNLSSIQLLQKLGLQAIGEIEVDGKKPLLFSIVAD